MPIADFSGVVAVAAVSKRSRHLAAGLLGVGGAGSGSGGGSGSGSSSGGGRQAVPMLSPRLTRRQRALLQAQQ